MFSLTFCFKKYQIVSLKIWRENLITDGELMKELRSIRIRSTEQ